MSQEYKEKKSRCGNAIITKVLIMWGGKKEVDEQVFTIVGVTGV